MLPKFKQEAVFGRLILNAFGATLDAIAALKESLPTEPTQNTGDALALLAQCIQAERKRYIDLIICLEESLVRLPTSDEDLPNSAISHLILNPMRINYGSEQF